MVLALEKCCFCGDLRTGSLIIGHMTLKITDRFIEKATRDIILSLVSLIYILIFTACGTNWYLNSADRNVVTAGSILLLLGIANIIFTIIMLFGIYEYKRRYLKVYLIFNVVIMVIAVLLILILCIVIELPGLIILGLVFLAFHSYYLLVIRSYYLKIDDRPHEAARYFTELTAEQLA